ncbi:MAG: four helix bundle protein [Candidatus Yanofskybacteria bacterium]|nr:four helix bundle protein [Candidatus Yanofskybacteria bacterium]
MKSFKELIVWQKGIELVKEIYKNTAKFPFNEIYGLSSQMRRAAVSIPSNIAEGQQRKNLKEYLQFLRISYSSAAELETQLIISKDLYPKIDFEQSSSLLEEVQKMLNVIISKLEART